MASSFVQQVFAHPGSKWIFLGWSGFIAENLLLSENREQLVARVGEDQYRAAYGTLSTLACSSIVYGFVVHGFRTGPTVAPVPVRGAAFAVQALGLAMLASSALPKLQVPVSVARSPASSSAPSSPAPVPQPTLKLLCPVDFAHARNAEPNEMGLKRITRHPQLFALGLTALGTALSTSFLTTRILCGFPIVFAVIGGAHQDVRFLRSGSYSHDYVDSTSLMPFVALMTGNQKWSDLASEIKWVNVSLGVLVAGMLARRRMVLAKSPFISSN
ncbi:hypothetical protein BC830DRAFT_1138482, partial [Chytriomyces sp. MP71]